MEAQIASHYSDLSDKLRLAADYVIANPMEVATRSVRSISETTQISAPTFSRMARAVGFRDFDELKEECRIATRKATLSFSDRASELQRDEINIGSTAPFFMRQAAASVSNIESMVNDVPLSSVNGAVDLLEKARNVSLFGILGSSGFIDYLGYTSSWIARNWSIVKERDMSLSSALSNVTSDDVMLVMTMRPYAKKSVEVCRLASEIGAKVIVITDEIASPALKYADIGFRLPTESPQFFSSYVSTVVLLETIVGMLTSRGGENVRDRIASIEKLNCQIGEYHEA